MNINIVKITSIIGLFYTLNFAAAQDTAQTDKVYKRYEVDKEASFKGGEKELHKFVGQNLKYPRVEWKDTVDGKIIIKFIVEPDGMVENIHSIHKPNPILEKAVIAVIRKTNGMWTPAIKDGKTVRMVYILPIRFE